MATLTQPKSNKGLLVYSYKTNTEITIAAAHITSYKKLPDNEMLITSGADTNRLKFINEADCDAAIAVLDDTMGLISTEAVVSA